MSKIQQEEFARITADQLREKYSHLSEDDINFFISPGLEFKKGGIGSNKYKYLIEKRNSFDLYNQKYPNSEKMELSELELNQIANYEEGLGLNQIENKSIKPKKVDFITGVRVDKSNLYHGFLQSFKTLNGYDFILNQETIKNLEVVLKYFLKDEGFYKCDNLLKNIDGVDLVPDFNKGLLIIGNYGNGKSTMLKCFEYFFKHNYNIAYTKHWDNFQDWNYLRFKIVSCHEVVSEFECLQNPNDKDSFYKNYSGFKYGFDDIKKEKIASNFGLTNVMQTILEKRYDNRSKTFITMNFDDNYPNNLSKALDEMGSKYGNHIYDRIFEMFNIIEFKGKSFRK